MPRRVRQSSRSLHANHCCPRLAGGQLRLFLLARRARQSFSPSDCRRQGRGRGRLCACVCVFGGLGPSPQACTGRPAQVRRSGLPGHGSHRPPDGNDERPHHHCDWHHSGHCFRTWQARPLHEHRPWDCPLCLYFEDRCSNSGYICGMWRRGTVRTPRVSLVRR